MPENDWNKPVGYYDRKASPANLKSKSKKRQQDYDKLTEVVVIPYQNAKEKTVKTEAPTEPEKVAIPQIPSESQLNRSVNLSAGPNCLSLSETLMEIPTSAASVGLQDKVSRMIPPSSTITERSISAWLDRSYPGAVDAELPEVVHLDEIELASTMYESAREYCSIASERSAEIAVTQGENKLTEPINCEKSSIPVLQVVPSEKAMITPISVSSFSLLSAMDSAESLTSQGNSVCNSCDNSSDISESDGEDEHQGVKEVLWASNPQRSFLYVSDGRQQMTFMQKLCVVP